MHYFGTFTDGALSPHPVFAGHQQGYTQGTLVDHTSGSVHTGLSIGVLAPGGVLSPHVHAFEEGFYLLEGDAILSIDDHSYRLRPGDFGCLKVGTLHGWRNIGTAPARWMQMAAPQPKPPGEARDTFFKKGGQVPTMAQPLDLQRVDGHLLGHFDTSQIPEGDGGRIVSGGLKGVFLKWLLDEQFGAVHHRMLFIEYLPGVGIGPHDHTYEEAYFILTGEVEAIMDAKRYLAKPGDVLWTGTGCVHEFKNIGSQPVRWLETFSPQPPRENVFRFLAEWEQKAREIEG